MEELTPNLSMYIHPVVIVVTAPIWVSLRMLESACELIDRVPHSSSSQSDEIKKNSNNNTPKLTEYIWTHALFQFDSCTF